MSTSLQRIERAGIAVADDPMADWQMIREQAKVLVASGFLPSSVKTPEAAMAIILTGRELGIGPMAALNNINVIQGKPTLSPQLMLGMVNGTNQVEDIRIEADVNGATVTVKRKGRSPYTTTFGPKEAKAMQLDGKDNYRKQPATMYQWRAVAANLRVTFPDVIMGMYTPDEMGATVTADGDVIEGLGPSPIRPQTVETASEVVRVDEHGEVVTEEPRPTPVVSSRPKVDQLQQKRDRADEILGKLMKAGIPPHQIDKLLAGVSIADDDEAAITNLITRLASALNEINETAKSAKKA